MDDAIIKGLKGVCSRLSFGTDHAAVKAAITEIERLRALIEKQNDAPHE